jgi:Serine carboxypeptidase
MLSAVNRVVLLVGLVAGLAHCGSPAVAPKAEPPEMPPAPVQPAPRPMPPRPVVPEVPPLVDSPTFSGALPAVVAQVVDEAGLVEVPPQEKGAKYSARMFYAFRAADTDPNDKPLFVFFNGGPGFATTGGLMSYGTGPMTLVDGAPAGSPPVENPSSFSRFANLLYIDERVTGFSYALLGEGGAQPDLACNYTAIADAGDFASVILQFLDAHPPLQAAPVVLVGESYGGVRATALLHLLFDSSDSKLVITDALRTAIGAHFAAVFPSAAKPTAASEVKKQFVGFVLIQPLVVGELQYAAQATLFPMDPYVGSRYDNPKYDPYDLSKLDGWSTTLDIRSTQALSDPKASAALVGVELGSIPLLLPPARATAFRPPLSKTLDDDYPAEVAANAELSTHLGALGADDHYYSTMLMSCDSATRDEQSVNMGYWFLDDLAYAHLFLTHARWDGVIYTPSIPYVFQQAGVPVTIDTTPRPGYARPGWIDISLPAQGSLPASDVEIRYPSYDSAGHMVAVSQGGDLADDVEQWLTEDVKLPSPM